MRRLHFAEVRVQVEAVRTGLADRVVVVGAIKEIVELGTESQHSAFAEYLESLLDSEVHVDVIGPAELIAPAIASTGAAIRLRAERAEGEEEPAGSGTRRII